MSEADGVRAQIDVILENLETAQKSLISAVNTMDVVEGGVLLLTGINSLDDYANLDLGMQLPDAKRHALESFVATQNLANSLMDLKDRF